MALAVRNSSLGHVLAKLILHRSVGPCAVASLNLVRNYAARKGTRDRKTKKKGVKVVEQKVGFIPHNQRDKAKMLLNREKKKYDDSYKPLPIDNVYFQKYYRWKIYSFVEAVQCHKETHHPEIYNQPNAKLIVNVELNMEGEKKTKFIENFSRIAPMPHKFEHGADRSILVFTKSPKLQEEVKKMGAHLVGGVEIIKDIQNGTVLLHDFEHVIAHPHILPELVSLRGLMKRKFPNPKNGSLNSDLVSAVQKFLHGVSYTAIKDEHEKNFGLITTSVGTLDMDVNCLEENFASFIKDVYQMKPKREGTFIDRCLLLSPPSREKLKIGYEHYLTKVQVVSDDEDEEDDKQTATG